MTAARLPSSFRDPAGFIFTEDGLFYRQITECGSTAFRQLIDSGLQETLCKDNLTLPFELISEDSEWVVLLPKQLSFISYPYEWCFSQLKDAALTTLAIQERALSVGLSLKDASAYNIQFDEGKPKLIDTSSFEIYSEGRPWIAYRQFCTHFLAPLLLMSKVSPDFGRTQAAFIDGIPLPLAVASVPRRTWLNPWLNLHLKQHAKAVADSPEHSPAQSRVMPKSAVLGLLKTLTSAVNGLKFNPKKSSWGDYSSSTSYTDAGSKDKARVVQVFLEALPNSPDQVWDIGANAGEFSRLFSDRGINTVAWDGDMNAVERNYSSVRQKEETRMLPLMQDITNPSPSLGWANEERDSLTARGPADLAVSLAFIHHMVIGNSVPMAKVADFFAQIGRYLIIEFVQPEDQRVKQLQASRDICHPYSEQVFVTEFSKKFDIVKREQIAKSDRTLFLLKRS